MGISIRIPGATFSKFVDREAPHIELASGFWLFGGSKEESQVNLAPNAPAGTPSWAGTGAPSFGSGYAQMSPGGSTSSSLDTGILASPRFPYTMIAVATASGGGHMISGTYHGGVSSLSHMLYSVASTRVVTGYIRGINIVGPAPSASELTFMSLTRLSDTSGRLQVGTAGGLVTVNGGGNAGGTEHGFRIGPVGGFGTQASTVVTRHAANMYFPVALTEQQVAEIYSYLKWKLSTRGVAVA